jgi:(R,R)-butanediol dehydrogenase/meso-butanediol dehydrogenase/diacetyl reductase
MKKTIVAVKIGNMKAADEASRGKVQTIEMPDLPVGPKDVKIRVAYCSICGSDPHIVGGIFPDRVVPFGLGHELSGVVEELGSEATIKGLKVGDRVAGSFLKYCGSCYYCNNGQQQFCTNAKDEADSPGMSEYVVWDEGQVWKLPDDVSLKDACLLEPVSIATRIVDKANMKIGSRVAIQGGGPIGLLTLQLMKIHGATSLTMIEPIKNRRELATSFGADYVIDPSEQDVLAECDKITNGLGFDIVVEASGFAPAATIPVEIAARGGTVLYIAMFPADYEMPLNLYDKCYKKELTITGTLVAPYTFPRAVALLSRMNLAPFTQNIFSIDEPEEAFAAHLSGRFPKILIRCNNLD